MANKEFIQTVNKYQALVEATALVVAIDPELAKPLGVAAIEAFNEAHEQYEAILAECSVQGVDVPDDVQLTYFAMGTAMVHFRRDCAAVVRTRPEGSPKPPVLN